MDLTWGLKKIENDFERETCKLHLGCGKRYIPGFIHVDLADYPHIDYRQDISDLYNLPSNSADLIYCSHALEYFDRVEAAKVLEEWHRVLKKDGILRLAVPDFEALVEVYLKNKKMDLIHGPLYGRMVVKTPSGEKMVYHKTCYDFESLSCLLKKCGFVDVHRYDWSLTEHIDFDDFSQAYIPHMDKAHGKLISLNVEAKKP